MRNTARRTTALAIVAFLGLTACGGDDAGGEAAEDAIERAGGGDVDVEVDEDSGGYRIETGDGSVDVSSSGDLPADWPADVPLPDGLVITGGSSIDGGSSGQLVAVSGTVAMSVEEVDAFYADALGEWTEALRTSSTTDGDRFFNVSYQRDDRSLSVGGTERDGHTELGFSYTYFPTDGASGQEAAGDGAGAATDVEAGDLGIDGVDEALDALGPEGVAGALVLALDADRYEVVDGTIHVYLGDDSGYEPMVACIAATAVVTEAPVVVHDAAGTETAC